MIRFLATLMLLLLLSGCPLVGAYSSQEREKERKQKEEWGPVCLAAIVNYSTNCPSYAGTRAASCDNDYATCTLACMAAEVPIACLMIL